MKNNNIEKNIISEILTIEYTKNKYFFIGFLIGIIPFILISILIKDNNFIILKLLLIIIGITVSFTNAIILKNKIYDKLINFFETKNQLNFFEIKKSHQI